MRNMSWQGLILVLLLASAAVLVQACQQSEPAEQSKQSAEQTKEPAEASGDGDLEPIAIDLPNAVFEGTPEPRRYGTHVEKLLGKPRPPFMAPKGTTNVALKKPVSGSDEFPIIGELKLITDGDKEALDGRFVELGPGRQYVQIDLGAEYNIYAVVIWHRHQEPRVYHDVIVQACSDPDFITDVTTVFNNDYDNSAGLGVGENWERIETNEGHLIDSKGVKGRYVRCYSNGNTTNDLNHYIEVEVYGKPAPCQQSEPAAPPPPESPAVTEPAAPSAEPAAEPKEPAEQPKQPAEKAAKSAEQPKEPAEAAGDGDLEPIVIELPIPHY